MVKQNNPARNHHFVPQHYLRAFTIPETEKIWEYKVGRLFEPNAPSRNRSPWENHIKRSCMIRDFYAYETDAGAVDFETFEKDLKKTEDILLPSLNRLREVKSLMDYEAFLQDYKADFTDYILLMHQRGQERRKAVLDMLEEYTNDPEIAGISQGKKDETMHQTMFHINRVTYDLIFNSTWLYLYPPWGKCFVTSDSPVGVRLNPDGLVSLPISPHYALVISSTASHPDRRTQSTMERASSSTWIDINKMTAFDANHIYHNKCEEWVSELSK